MEDVLFVMVLPGEGDGGGRWLTEEKGENQVDLAHHVFFGGGEGG